MILEEMGGRITSYELVAGNQPSATLNATKCPTVTTKEVFELLDSIKPDRQLIGAAAAQRHTLKPRACTCYFVNCSRTSPDQLKPAYPAAPVVIRTALHI
jgi:hypothetical protein